MRLTLNLGNKSLLKSSEGQRVFVLGAGVSGVSAARLAVALHYDVTILDTGTPPPERLAGLRGVHIFSGPDALRWSGTPDVVIFSPGVPLDSPLARLADATGAPQISELAFGASFIKCPILAVTGTNGKTTTVEMLEWALKHMGLNAIAVGNIGLPLSELVLRNGEYDFIVAEVSSFQLEHPGRFAPAVAALLNITPDHIVRHHTMQRYIDTKLALFCSNPPPKIVVNSATLQIEQVARALNNSPVLTFSANPNLCADFAFDGRALVRNSSSGPAILTMADNLPFTASHNLENALAALAVIDAAGLDVAAAAATLSSFRTGAHRLQTVAASGAITFIDDSKATNVDALIKALDSLKYCKRDIALIAGGFDKDCSLDEAIPALRSTVKSITLIGQCAPRLMKSWGTAVPAAICHTIEDAVTAAANTIPSGGIVLLSPACASQDMFRDYEERGNAFAAAAKQFCTKQQQI